MVLANYLIMDDCGNYCGTTNSLEEAEEIAKANTSCDVDVYIYEVKLKGEAYIPEPEPETHFFY